MPLTWTCPTTKKVFQTGLRPSSRLALANKTPFRPTAAPPENSGWFPTYRSMYCNDRFGICVTAEEAYAKSCFGYIIPDAVVLAYARAHGTQNGASLVEVLQSMQSRGFQVGPQLYNDGPSSSVDYTSSTVLRAAAAQGPVKIAIDSSCLPGGAGSEDGFLCLRANGRGSDHCVSLSGQGTAEWIFDQLKKPLPSGVSRQTRGYPIYTWGTIGFATDEWVGGATDEADLRDPTNLGVPPLAPLVPPPPPVAPPIIGTLRAVQVGQYISISGSLKTADGFEYIAVPDGTGVTGYHVIPKVSF